MKLIKFSILATIVPVMFVGCTNTQALPSKADQSKVVAIIAQMPAHDSQQQADLAAQLAAMNPQSTTVLTGMLLPPADPNDNAARYGLSALTHYTARHGAEAERAVYAAALIDALEIVPEKQNQAFLISQLQFAGQEEAVKPLGGYLNDDVLCDYAARALLTIGTDGVEAEFLEALDSATGANKVTIIKALGELRSKAAAKKITPSTKSKDLNTRETALYALANIGDPSSQKILSESTQVKDNYKRAKYTSLYLLYARRQAQAGNMNRCAQICNQVIRRNKDNPNIRTAAINTLRSSTGDDIDKITDPKLRKLLQKYMDQSPDVAASQVPAGFVSLFNGKDLTGWKLHDGLPGETEPTGKWTVEDGAIVGVQDPPGKGGFLTTTETFRDFELMLETKIDWPFDSGVFLRVGPDGKSHQVTLDYRDGGEIGGIYCPWTQGFVHHCSDGIKSFNKDQWNKLRITCEGQPARIKVWLNSTQITDFQHTEATTAGIPEEGTICLQIHPGGEGYDKSQARFRNIFVRRLDGAEKINVLTKQEKADGFVSLFNGRDLTGWVGSKATYGIKNGILFCRKGTGRNIYTEKEYDNFVLRFEFKLQPGTNNGLGIRTPLKGDAAYVGMELQILDNTAEKYSNLHNWQYHGSVYGIVAADKTKRESAFNPVGEWNYEEVIADSTRIIVKVNGETIVDADIKEASKNGTLSGKEHPGLLNETGHIGFLGHGDYVEFRNLRIKEL
ncbi:MAG: DUF1080 domain-containing protein [Planctomycetota bacterium]